MTTTIYKWLGSGYLLGVTPTRDLTVAEWDALTDAQKATIKPYYKKVTLKPDASKRRAPKPNAQEI